MNPCKARTAALRDQEISFVRVLWCDNANVIRAKAPHLRTVARSGGAVGISAAQQALPVMYDSVVPDSGLGPIGEVQLVPDWSTLHTLPYLPGYAQVIGDMRVKDQPWEHCPRDFLKRQIARLAARGLTVQAAFENEFFLLRPGKSGDTGSSVGNGMGMVPSDNTVFAAAHAMNATGGVILEIAAALAAQGLEVESYYPESGPGQHELPVRYRDALTAADQQLVYRETVRGVAARHGLVASFLPKVVADKAGSGCHLNLSLWRGGENVTGVAATGLDALGTALERSGLGSETEAFIAGLLEHLRALCALTIPSPNSYRRIRPHFWVGAFTAWGIDNREAAIRVFKGGTDAPPKRFEIKCVDATANPYLALGAVLAAGLDGLERDLPLPAEVRDDPGYLSEEAREALGVVPLPKDLAEAITALEADPILLEALGEARARAYLAVRRAEREALSGLSLEDEVAMLLERY